MPGGTLAAFNQLARSSEAFASAVYLTANVAVDKATRDAGWAKLMQDERMQPDGESPFDGKRMFWGGFKGLVELQRKS